jgi:16S rRNA processing protein RimM
MSDSAAREVLLGKLVGAFGVRGEVKLESFTSPRLAIFGYQPWTLRSRHGDRVVVGASGREQGKGIAARLPEVETRDQAEALIGAEIWVPRSALPRPKPGEYYWVDLEGLAVFTTDGTALGAVSHLFETAANDVMVVRGERERLIPFILDRYVTRIDLEARRIEVDWDPGF